MQHVIRAKLTTQEYRCFITGGKPRKKQNGKNGQLRPLQENGMMSKSTIDRIFPSLLMLKIYDGNKVV